MKQAHTTERIVFLDWLRVIACFMVMLVHSIEPFYLDADGTCILNKTDALWATFLDSALRAAVPLFVMTSSYLLFPIKTDTKSFFKRRFTRVLIPFIIWSLVYAIAWSAEDGVLENFKHLIFNFMGASGHLWFIYMLLGIYLLMPLLSPWAEKVSKRGERAFLILWAVTTTFPLIRQFGLAVTGSTEMWGEASWNDFGTFYYVSGFIGYIVLAHYFRTWVGELNWRKTLAIAIPLWIIGYAITASWFWAHIPSEYPIKTSIDLAVLMERSWVFCACGVAMTTVAYFLIFRKIHLSGGFYRAVVLPISKISYGMYLMHMLILVYVCDKLRPVLENTLPVETSTPFCIFGTVIITYIASALFTRIFSLIPKVGKFIVG